MGFCQDSTHVSDARHFQRPSARGGNSHALAGATKASDVSDWSTLRLCRTASGGRFQLESCDGQGATVLDGRRKLGPLRPWCGW